MFEPPLWRESFNMHNSKQYSKPQGAGKPHSGGAKSYGGGAKPYGASTHGGAKSYGGGVKPYGASPHGAKPYGVSKLSRPGASAARGNAVGADADETRVYGKPHSAKPFGAGRSYGNGGSRLQDTKRGGSSCPTHGGKPRYSHTPRYARDNALAGRTQRPRPTATADTRDTDDSYDTSGDTAQESEAQDNLIYGRNPVKEYLLSGQPANVLYTAVGVGGLTDIIALAREQGVPVKEVPRDKLDKICRFGGVGSAVGAGVASGSGGASGAVGAGGAGGRNGGIALEVAAARYVEINDMLDIARSRNEPPFIIISDGITDPHNLGAIIRTALSAGAHGVVIPKRGGVSVTPAVAAASAGATAHLAVARVTNISETIELLKKEGVFVYGASVEGGNYRAATLSGAVALVIGNEGDGLRRLTRERCDALVGIDMLGAVGSLNASVCAGILMYEVVRSRAG